MFKRQGSTLRDNIKNLIIMIVVAALLSSLATMLIYTFVIVDDVDIIYYDVNVADHIGIILDPDKLHFGSVTPGSKLHRAVTFTADRKQMMVIEVTGTEFVFPSENNFLMEKDEQKKIQFTAHPPDETPLGLYEGKIIIISKRLF